MDAFSDILPGFEALYGNHTLKRYFSGEISARTLSHAYILEGGKGSGRHTLAFSVALAMAYFEGAPDAFAARVAARCSPDVRVFGVPDRKKTVGVDTVRLLKAEALLRPSELPFRVTVVEDAEFMTGPAQNAALKLLEEPPAGSYFFLLTQSAEALLETVRSRVVKVRMERFTEEALKAYLSSGHTSLPKIPPAASERISAAAARADGCIGRLLSLLSAFSSPTSGGKKETAAGMAATLLQAVGKKDPRAILPAVLALPGGQGSGREELSAVLADAEKRVRDLLLLHVGGKEPLTGFDFFEDARAAGRPFSFAELMRLRDTFHTGIARLAGGEGLTLFKSSLADALKRAVAP